MWTFPFLLVYFLSCSPYHKTMTSPSGLLQPTYNFSSIFFGIVSYFQIYIAPLMIEPLRSAPSRYRLLVSVKRNCTFQNFLFFLFTDISLPLTVRLLLPSQCIKVFFHLYPHYSNPHQRLKYRECQNVFPNRQQWNRTHTSRPTEEKFQTWAWHVLFV